MWNIKFILGCRYLCLADVVVAIASIGDGSSTDDVSESIERAVEALNGGGISNSLGNPPVDWTAAEDVDCVAQHLDGRVIALGTSPETLMAHLEQVLA